MKLKRDDKGAVVVVVENGVEKPVYVLEDGRDVPHDAPATVATISRLNGESKHQREAKEAAEAKLKAFEGIEDPEAAKKALETMKNLSTGDLKTAAQVQEIKDAAARSAQEAVANATRQAAEEAKALKEHNAKLTADLNNHIIGGSFASSKFIAEKMAIPADIAQKVFGDRFKVDNGKLVALDQTGNPLYSAVRHGEHADFEEALQVIVNSYPHRDAILKGSGASGSGATSSSTTVNGKKAVSRAQFETMSQAQRMEHAKSGGVVTD